MHQERRKVPGANSTQAPARERTMLGVGPSNETTASAMPIVSVAPAREDAALGVAGALAPATPPVEPSLAVDLVVKKPVPPRPVREESLIAAGVPRRSGSRWLVVLMVLTGAACGLYATRERIPWQRIRTLVGREAVSLPAPPMPVAPLTTAPPSTPAASAIPSLNAIATTPPAPSASATPASGASASKGTASASARKALGRTAAHTGPSTSASPGTGSLKRSERTDDNPY